MKKRIINVLIIAIIATIISVLMNQNEITKTLLNLVIDAYRSKIAAVNNITGYRGTPAQNTQMLNLLKQGKLIKP